MNKYIGKGGIFLYIAKLSPSPNSSRAGAELVLLAVLMSTSLSSRTHCGGGGDTRVNNPLKKLKYLPKFDC